MPKDRNPAHGTIAKIAAARDGYRALYPRWAANLATELSLQLEAIDEQLHALRTRVRQLETDTGRIHPADLNKLNELLDATYRNEAKNVA